MKIWIINHYAIPPAFGGLNRHYYFSKKLKKRGHKVRIFSSGKIHNTDLNFSTKNLYNIVESDGVEYTFIKSMNYSGNGIGRLLSFLQFPINTYRTINKFFKVEKPDAIYASSPELFATAVAVWFAKRKRIPILVEIRDLWPESVVAYTSLTKRNLVIRLLYKLERWIYSKCDALSFTFEGGKDYIVNSGWDKQGKNLVDMDKIHYVNNGVDIKGFEECAKKWLATDEELDSDKFKVVYAGSIRRVNSVWIIVECAKLFKEKGIDDISFIIYGDGTEKEALEKEAKENNLTNVTFRSRVDKKYIPSILQRADLNVFVGEDDPMNQYGLSLNKLFDYMAAGKPILANIESGYDNILKYQCGKIVQSGSPEAFGEGILSIKNMDKTEYKQLCSNSLKAAEDFDFENLTDKLEQIFSKIVGRAYDETE